MDRVVTIKGSLSAVCQAAEKVYTKLKACYEADMQSLKYNVSRVCIENAIKTSANKSIPLLMIIDRLCKIIITDIRYGKF